jgi:hypothetical protein
MSADEFDDSQTRPDHGPPRCRVAVAERTRPRQSDAKSDALRPQSGTKSVTAPDRVGSQRFVPIARNPPNAAWLCRSLRAGTTTCDSSQWAERDSNPLRFTAGFEGSGAKRRRKRHTGDGARLARRARWGGTGRGRLEWGSGGLRRGRRHTGRRGGSGADGAGQQAGRGRGHGSSLAQGACSWPDGGADRGD